MGVDVTVTVQPKSSQNKIALDGDSIKVWVSSPPVDGAANEAVIKLLAKVLGIAKSKIFFVRGETSRLKTLRIEGLTEKELYERLRTP